jgi:hypothetical protein
MSQQKKTRTKSTERLSTRFRQMRMEVAAEAARIIATEGQHNYRAAKKKAAERVGVSERLALPSNIEVRQALSSYQALYGGSLHHDNLERLRTVAMRAMRLLVEFKPRLVGPVLDGTADEHSRVALHVFCDSPDFLVHYFLEKGAAFQQEQRQIRWHDGKHRTLPIILFELDETTIELGVFDLLNLRQAPPSPIDGKPQQRANLSEVESLLDSPDQDRLSMGT